MRLWNFKSIEKKGNVFCINCLFHVKEEANLCNAARATKKGKLVSHPVYGRIEVVPDQESCMRKNSRCDCQDFQPKEEEEKNRSPLYKQFLKDMGVLEK